MHVVIELYDPLKNGNHQLLSDIAQETIDTTGLIHNSVVTITVSVAIVPPQEIRRINKEFRGKDAVTDVISVGDYSDDRSIDQEKKAHIFIGEVILCYNDIAVAAKENDIAVEKEFFSVFIHGILHLMGFQHGKKMFALQDRISEKYYLQIREYEELHNDE